MSAKDRERLKVLHEVRKRHITQVQAAKELGVSSRCWFGAEIERTSGS
jgi:DNA-binding XRE family transcriptional regulator